MTVGSCSIIGALGGMLRPRVVLSVLLLDCVISVYCIWTMMQVSPSRVALHGLELPAHAKSIEPLGVGLN